MQLQYFDHEIQSHNEMERIKMVKTFFCERKEGKWVKLFFVDTTNPLATLKQYANIVGSLDSVEHDENYQDNESNHYAR